MINSNDVGKGSPYVFQLPPTGLPRHFRVVVRNTSLETTEPISHVYLFSPEQSSFSIAALDGEFPGWSSLDFHKSHITDEQNGLGRQYPLPNRIPAVPPGALEAFSLGMQGEPKKLSEPAVEETMRLQLHTGNKSYKYTFKVAL